MSDLPDRVDHEIQTRGLFRRGQKILVAVSGGLDSMVLLALLHGLSRSHSWRLTVAHLNHGLRGRSSDADERLVVRTAKKLRLPVVTAREDVRDFAASGRLSIEMAARKLRHDFLARTAMRLKIPGIALAHHADDQVELFFLRLLRGSGAEGLAGMKWRNPSPAQPRVDLVRPLLGISRMDLAAFAAAHHVAFREDATNARLDIERNRIRHQLLPLLRRSYQPALSGIVLRLIDILGAESEVIARAAEAWLKQRTPFSQLPVAVQRRSLQLQLFRHQIAPDFELIEKLRMRPGRAVSVLPGCAVVRGTDGVIELSRSATVAARSGQRTWTVRGEQGQFVFDGTEFDWRITKERSLRLPDRRAGHEVFDADRIGSRIVLRHWRAGDRFQPIGMFSAVKLQDLFTNQKIPRAQRHRLIVATTAAGELFWVETLRIGERFKVSDATIRRLHWRWKRL